MSITIHKNPDVALDIPKFTCDTNSVGEHLEDHDLLKLLNVYGFMVIIGRPASGKTSLAISLITQSNPRIYKKTHHHLLVCMPTNSIASLKHNPFKSLDPSNFYNELTNTSIENMYDRINAYSKDGEKTILFLDDQTASLKASKYIQETLKKMIYNRRHLKLNIIITAQSYVNLPLDTRKNIQNLVLFKPSKREVELVFSELLEKNKETALDVMKLVFDNLHNFLFLNVPSQKVFKNFDELVFQE